VSGTSLLWGNTTDHLGTVGKSVLGVESTLFTSETLGDNLGVLVDKKVL